jgi:5-(aminomethyl)-3-furanmethanol phosphate kinase
MNPVVVKIGGGLLGVPGALDTTCAAVAELGRREPVVVVPGGGALADAVRSLDRRLGLSSDASHWMAILAMDQTAHLLAERIGGAVLVEEPGAIGGALASGRVAILAPSRWLRAADPLPHSWDATSDSISVFVAVALDARRLVLVKPAEVGPEGVDGGFRGLVPVGLEVSVTGWERFVAGVRGASPPTAAPQGVRPAPAG